MLKNISNSLLAVRSDTKEPRETAGKLKSKHKLSDVSTDSERAQKESRHESYGRDRSSQAEAERTERVQHRDEKRGDARTSADKVHDADVRLKDRSHRTDVDADIRGESDHGHRTTERDQLSTDDVVTGNRSGDGHRRSAEIAAGKPADERGKNTTSFTFCLTGLFFRLLLQVRPVPQCKIYWDCSARVFILKHAAYPSVVQPAVSKHRG